MADTSALPACCRTQCHRGPLTTSSGRADARAFSLSTEQRRGLQNKWGQDGGASFHSQCWFDILREANQEPSQIGAIEKQLLNEAMKTVEIHDSDEQIQIEAAKIAKLMKASKHCILFTGAGISTAAGIGDFRGIHGKWTNIDKQKDFGPQKTSASAGVSTVNLRPTYTHDAIVKLIDLGIVKYLISQNCDGLHVLSGVPADRIAELHGNSFMEKCEDCGTRYPRSHPIRHSGKNVPQKPCPGCKIDHRTGRKCEKMGCHGYLMNTIINFGDNLESHVLDNAFSQAKLNDFCLCLGSSLRVSPANSLVTEGPAPVRLAICNRQETPYDSICSNLDKDGQPLGSRVFGDCDRLMQLIMTSILSPDDLQAWERDRGRRLALYATKRDK